MSMLTGMCRILVRHKKRREQSDLFGLLFLLLAICALPYKVLAQSDPVVDTIIWPVKIRDFDIDQHPDFETYQGSGMEGGVEPILVHTDDSSSFAGDERGPKLAMWGAGTHWTSEESFAQWYNDVEGVNRRFRIDLAFLVHESGLITYNNSSFFPLNTNMPYTSLSDPPQEPFDNFHNGNNFGFTTEFHATFTYLRDKNQVFSFTGDDDVWVFINDSLVIDLGGVHPEKSDSIALNDLPEGFLEDGKSYTFDFYHAERHTVASNVKITTSILLIPRIRTRMAIAKIRDFKEANKIDTAGMHPDFNFYTCGHQRQTPGMIEKKIVLGPVTTPFFGDNRQIIATQPYQCLTDSLHFSQWYNDVPGVNRSFYIDLAFNEIEPGIWGISYSNFFPIDKDSLWIPAIPGGPNPFGHLQDTTYLNHNFGFTTEIHATVTYHKGTGQFFFFIGDDDVWAFVNDSLVMDLGGVHIAQGDSIWLDSLAEGFLEDGKTYPFDFYHAERHITESHVVIKTNFELKVPAMKGVVPGINFARSTRFDTLYSFDTYVKSQNDTLFIQITDDSKTKAVDNTAIELYGLRGEKETVTLTETAHGVYRGFIPFGLSGNAFPGNGILDVKAGEQLSYHYYSIGEEDEAAYTDTIILPDYPSEVTFCTDASCSTAYSLTDYCMLNDTLYIQIKDDSKTSGADQVTIDLMGAAGEKETVALTETSPGIYRGSIAFAPEGATPAPNNAKFDVRVGDPISYSYAGIDEAELNTASSILEGIPAEIEFFNDNTYSSDLFGPYQRYSDTLYIQATDDSKSSGIDTVFITITGPEGEKETISLIETAPGVYRGFIAFGSPASRSPDNNVLEIGIGEDYSYMYSGIGAEQPAPVAAKLDAPTYKIIFANNPTYADAVNPSNYTKTSDALYIRIYDDSKTAATDTVTVTLGQVVEFGQPRDRETVTLIEKSKGVYEGAIPYSSPSSKKPDNGYLEMGPGETMQIAYNPINEDIGPILKIVINGIETSIIHDPLVRIKVFRALSTHEGTRFALPGTGTLRLYSVNGRLLADIANDTPRIIRIDNLGGSKFIIYRWKTRKTVKIGKLLIK